MVGAILPAAIAGLLLVFFVPGYALTKALFPEWRLRGKERYLRLLEIVTLAFVLSVVLTVLVGYALLTGAPGGFQAYWTDPLLETILAGLAAVAFVLSWVRGAYRREPPSPRAPEDDPASESAWELSRELERLAREERRLNHELRTRAGDQRDVARLLEELDRVRAHRDQLREHREAEYAA